MQNFGFSLLELLIVICISAICAAIGMQQWKEIQLRNELVSTTHQLAYFLNEVQVKANTENKNYSLHLFLSPWCLTITSGEPPTSCQNGLLQFIKSNNSVEIKLLNEQKIITFWGRRNMAQTGSFELSNAIGTTRVLISFRGRIRFCRINSYLPSLPAC